MKQQNHQTALVALGALLWLATTVLAWTGHWYAGLFVLLALMATYALLGIAHRGRISVRILVFPLVLWLLFYPQQPLEKEFRKKARKPGMF